MAHLLVNLPTSLRDSANWLVANADKIPVRPMTTQQVSGDRLAHTLPFSQASSLVLSGHHDHVIYMHHSDEPYSSLDVDHARDPHTGALTGWFCELLDTLDGVLGYIELSTSGTGFRIPCEGKAPFGKKAFFTTTKRQGKGCPKVEVICENSPACYTGNIAEQCYRPDTLTPIEPVVHFLQTRYRQNDDFPATRERVDKNSDNLTLDSAAVNDALYCIPPDINHDDWKKIGMSLHSCNASVVGFDLWDEWSKGADNYDPRAIKSAWRSFKTSGGISIGTLFHIAKEYGYQPKKNGVDSYPSKPPDPPHPATIDPMPLVTVQTAPAPIRFFDVGRIMTMTKPDFLVEDIIPLTGLGQIFGESGTYKTFLAVDLALCVASGKPWLGKPTVQGTALFLCGEGQYGIAQRIKAWVMDNPNYPVSNDSFKLSPQLPHLTQMSQLLAYCQELEQISQTKIRIVVIDTFARLMSQGYGSEDRNDDVSKYINEIELFGRSLNCVIVQIHHTGHVSKERARGGYALYAGLDFEYRLFHPHPDGNEVCFKSTKAKEFNATDNIYLISRNVSIDKGESESLVLDVKDSDWKPTHHPMIEDKTKGLHRKQQMAMELFWQMYYQHEENGKDHPNVVPKVLLYDFMGAMINRNIYDRKHAKTGLHSLIKRGLIAQDGMYLTIPSDDGEEGSDRG